MNSTAERIPAAMVPKSVTWENFFYQRPDPALYAAQEEIRELEARMAERDADDGLLDRVLREVPCLAFHICGEPAPTWPPRWLREMVANGRADALQADRALVAKRTPNIYGESTAPIPMPSGARWFRHAEQPRGFDAAVHASATRVLARCEGRR